MDKKLDRRRLSPGCIYIGLLPQLSLDIQADTVASSSVIEAKQIAYIKTKTAIAKKPIIHPGRGKLSEHLRRVETVIEPITFLKAV